MAARQAKFYDKRFSSEKRGFNKLQNRVVLFYDMRLIDIMLANLKVKSVDRILEVGCGQGTDSILVSKHARNVVAIDISTYALRVAEKLSRINNCFERMFVAADADNLPFRTGVFDLVFCKDLLHHLFDSARALSEMKFVAKVDGKVVAIEANAWNPQMILIGLIYYSVDKGVFKNTKANLINTFRRAGFFDVGAEEIEFLPRHLLFEYRSPLCVSYISNSRLVLEVLRKIEDGMQKLGLTKIFSNYIVIYAYKN